MCGRGEVRREGVGGRGWVSGHRLGEECPTLSTLHWVCWLVCGRLHTCSHTIGLPPPVAACVLTSDKAVQQRGRGRSEVVTITVQADRVVSGSDVVSDGYA